MSFINALTSYARRGKSSPAEVYSNAIRKKPVLMDQSIFVEINKTQKDPFAGLSENCTGDAYGLSCGLRSLC